MRPAPIITMSLMILWLLFSAIKLTLAGNQYCYPKGNTNRFQISRKLEFIEDQIIPRTDGDPVPADGLNCKWKISNDHLDDPIIVLTGFDSNEHLSRQRRTRSVDSTSQPQLMRYELHSQASNSNCSPTSTRYSKPVELTMLRVMQLSRGSNLRVSFRLTQKSSADTPAGLRIRLMEPGFCYTDVTNFENNCYTTTTVSRSLNEELAAIKEDSSVMRLASFNSSKALQNFVIESQRTRVGSGVGTRTKEPLNLTHSLRIGMFYEHRTKKVFYLNSDGDGFVMAELRDANGLNFTVPASNSPIFCGSLRAVQQPGGGGEAVGLVDFANCSQPLPALISFADAARTRCDNSSATTVLSWLCEVHKKEKRDSSYAEIDIIIAVATIAPVVILVAVFAIIYVCLSRIGKCNYRLRMAADNSAPRFRKPEVAEKPVLLLAVKHEPSSLKSTDLDCTDTTEETSLDAICTDAETAL